MNFVNFNAAFFFKLKKTWDLVVHVPGHLAPASWVMPRPGLGWVKTIFLQSLPQQPSLPKHRLSSLRLRIETSSSELGQLPFGTVLTLFGSSTSIFRFRFSERSCLEEDYRGRDNTGLISLLCRSVSRPKPYL